MGLPPAPSVTTFHIVATVVPVVALIITVFRLVHRHRRKLSWWDDALIGMAALSMLMLVISVWFLTGNASIPHSTKVSLYFVCAYTFTISIYTARLCILFGIMRIAPNPATRNFIRWIAGFFVVILCVLMAQKIWVCEGNTAWKLEPSPACHLGLQVAVTELVTDIVSDTILVLLPIFFLWGSRLRAGQKRRVYAIFSASCITTIVSIVQDWLILAAGGLREETASMIEVSVSVIVANLPFLVSAVYRFFRENESNHTVGTSSIGRSRGRIIHVKEASSRPQHTIRLDSVTSKPQPAVLRGHSPDHLSSWGSKRSRGYDVELVLGEPDLVDKPSPDDDSQHDVAPFSFQNPPSSSDLKHSKVNPQNMPPLNDGAVRHHGDEGLVRVEIVAGIEDYDDDDGEERPHNRAPSDFRRRTPLSAGVRIEQEVVVSTDPIPSSPVQRQLPRFKNQTV